MGETHDGSIEERVRIRRLGEKLVDVEERVLGDFAAAGEVVDFALVRYRWQRGGSAGVTKSRKVQAERTLEERLEDGALFVVRDLLELCEHVIRFSTVSQSHIYTRSSLERRNGFIRASGTDLVSALRGSCARRGSPLSRRQSRGPERPLCAAGPRG